METKVKKVTRLSWNEDEKILTNRAKHQMIQLQAQNKGVKFTLSPIYSTNYHTNAQVINFYNIHATIDIDTVEEKTLILVKSKQDWLRKDYENYVRYSPEGKQRYNRPKLLLYCGYRDNWTDESLLSEVLNENDGTLQEIWEESARDWSELPEIKWNDCMAWSDGLRNNMRRSTMTVWDATDFQTVYWKMTANVEVANIVVTTNKELLKTMEWWTEGGRVRSQKVTNNRRWGLSVSTYEGIDDGSNSIIAHMIEDVKVRVKAQVDAELAEMEVIRDEVAKKLEWFK